MLNSKPRCKNGLKMQTDSPATILYTDVLSLY